MFIHIKAREYLEELDEIKRKILKWSLNNWNGKA